MLLAGWQRPDAGEIRYEPDGAPAGETCRGGGSRSCRSASACCPSCRCARTSSSRRGSRASSPSGRETVEELLAALGLDELADRPPHETSIGQQQRTALARALVARAATCCSPTSRPRTRTPAGATASGSCSTTLRQRERPA